MFLLNPCREKDTMTLFSVAADQIKNGTCVNLIIDLNVITRMEECIFENCQPGRLGLSLLIDLLNNNAIMTSPGLSIREVKYEYAAKARGAFEGFISQYCQNNKDTPETTQNTKIDVYQTRNYDDIIPDRKKLFSAAYASMILLFLVSAKEDLSPEERFELYIQRMAHHTGFIGVLETRIAQFVFYDRSTVTNNLWSKFCKTIRNNFLKSGATKEKILLNSLNQAHDILLIRSSSMMHGISEGGYKLDLWIATFDEGVANLCSTFRYNTGDDGKYNGEFIYIDSLFDEMTCDDYWINTNKKLEEIYSKRTPPKEIDFDYIDKNIECLISEVEAIIK